MRINISRQKVIHTLAVIDMDNRIPVLEGFNQAADEPLRPLRGCVDGDEGERAFWCRHIAVVYNSIKGYGNEHMRMVLFLELSYIPTPTSPQSLPTLEILYRVQPVVLEERLEVTPELCSLIYYKSSADT